MINLKWEYKRVQIKYETKSELELKLNFSDSRMPHLIMTSELPKITIG